MVAFCSKTVPLWDHGAAETWVCRENNRSRRHGPVRLTQSAVESVAPTRSPSFTIWPEFPGFELTDEHLHEHVPEARA